MKKKLDRRGFLSGGAKVLPALAVMGLALTVAPKAASADCMGFCAGECVGSCQNTCEGQCHYDCKDSCAGECRGNCKGDCTGSSK